VDNHVSKSQYLAKDGTYGVRIQRSAYFIGICLISVVPQVIVVLA